MLCARSVRSVGAMSREAWLISYTETVDKWLTAHAEIKPALALLSRAEKWFASWAKIPSYGVAR